MSVAVCSDETCYRCVVVPSHVTDSDTLLLCWIPPLVVYSLHLPVCVRGQHIARVYVDMWERFNMSKLLEAR